MKPRGFTLIETILALSILMVVLSVSNVMFRDQGIVNRQVTVNQATEDARLALLRIDEIASQAAYIYPRGRTIQISSSSSVTTGVNALAMLLPYGSAYCKVSGTPTTAQSSSYCGYLYYTASRSSYASLLGTSPNNSGQVLLEYNVRWLTWGQNENPALTELNWYSGLTASTGVVVDSLDASTTNLGNLLISPRAGQGYDATTFPVGVTDLSATNVLIGGLRPTIALSYTNGIKASLINDTIVRSIPRFAPPGTGN